MTILVARKGKREWSTLEGHVAQIYRLKEHLMGRQKEQQTLFSYWINLEKRVRPDHPLGRVAAIVGFGFARVEVARCIAENKKLFPPSVRSFREPERG